MLVCDRTVAGQEAMRYEDSGAAKHFAFASGNLLALKLILERNGKDLFMNKTYLWEFSSYLSECECAIIKIRFRLYRL